ncbi:hypothetical protein AAFF_G00002300 [Aldrovandia affinis]|uniref:Myb-like domain-containing protein n=1 Tax=Aldrovandia affinis TaxID=143900 RepID=A0AAD7TEN2_9TELE|nr:hypothetical protein AAFF_G00002300 [Aldrovandia affinis]
MENKVHAEIKEEQPNKEAAEWTEEDLSQLMRSMAKFPEGMPGRWKKIAREPGRLVMDVSSAGNGGLGAGKQFGSQAVLLNSRTPGGAVASPVTLCLRV